MNERVRRTNSCASAAIYESERVFVYAAGGARGEVGEKTGTRAGVVSSGNGRKAMGSRVETHWVISGSAGA